MKIKDVEITQPELDALEYLATSWILCKKHNSRSWDKSDVEIYKMQNSCKECTKEVRKASSRGLHLWSKLIHAYCISRYGKCCDEINFGSLKHKNSKEFKKITDEGFGLAKGFTKPFERNKKV